MRVLVNATDAVLNTRALQRYVTALAERLPAQRGSDQVDLVFYTHRMLQVRSFLQQLPKGLECDHHMMWLPRRVLRHRFLGKSPQLKKLTAEVDLYHETTFDSPKIEDIPVVTTIHGLAHLEVPELLPKSYVEEKNRWIERAVERSSHFICVSDTCGQELQKHFNVPAERIAAIPLGVGSQFFTIARHQAYQAISDRFGLEGPYYLYVGGIQPNKNIPMLFETFSRFVKERGFPGKLVLAGDIHYEQSEFEEMLSRTGVRDQIFHVGFFHPLDPMLSCLYRAASAFLFPTFYEGWTSPPLESMACGTPVITSDCSSLPETVGSAAMTLDNADVDAWVDACQRLWEDVDVRSSYIQLGMMRAAMFSWERHASETWQFYRAIVGGELPDTRSVQMELELEEPTT